MQRSTPNTSGVEGSFLRFKNLGTVGRDRRSQFPGPSSGAIEVIKSKPKRIPRSILLIPQRSLGLVGHATKTLSPRFPSSITDPGELVEALIIPSSSVTDLGRGVGKSLSNC